MSKAARALRAPRAPRSPVARLKFVEVLERRTLLASPIVITKGGTYSGEWESFDRKTAAVIVKTSEPVVIENATIRGAGDLIRSGVDHTNITVRNVKGYGLNPNVYGATAGEFISLEQFDNLLVENSYFEHLTGINLLNYAGDRSPNETVRIIGNRARNIDGRKSDGNGGYLDFNTRTRKSDGHTEDGWEYAQFLQFDKVQNVPGVEVAWNEVINEPGKSRVEDVISVYKSSGTSNSPIRIHSNYIQGAYTIKPWQADTSDATYDYDWGFSGGGIMLGDGVGATAAQDPSFVKAYDNTIVSTTNYGIALSAGHDLEAYDNRVLSSALLPDGRKIANQNVGIYVWDSYKAGPTHFYNVSAHDNVSGWVQGGGRNDWWSPVSGALKNNTHWAGAISLMTELAEHARWKDLFAGRGGATPQPETPQPPPPQQPPQPPQPPVAEPPVQQPPPQQPPVQEPPVAQPPVDEPPVEEPPVEEPPVAQPPAEPPPPPVGEQPPAEEPVPPIDFPDPPVNQPPPVEPPVEEPTFPPVPAPGPQPEPDLEAIAIAGIAFNDADGDGTRDAGESVRRRQRVFVDLDSDRRWDKHDEPSDVTDADGRYEITAPTAAAAAGRLRMVLSRRQYATAAGTADGAPALDPDDATQQINLGVARFATVAGTAFQDADKDGKRDAGEAALIDWTVYVDANNNGRHDKGEALDKTDDAGQWTFTRVRAGAVYVRAFHGQLATTRGGGGASAITATLLSGGTSADNLFAVVPR